MMKNAPTASIKALLYPPRVLFEDPHLIVLSKPAGLLSQGEHTGDENLVDGLRAYFGRNYVGLVHRLDRNTSGLMVVAKRTKAAQRLTQALQAGEIKRTYLAWLIGKLPQKIRWEHELLKNPSTNVVRVISKNSDKSGKNAVLTATPVAYGTLGKTQLTLTEFVLETGRSHQIRAQASHEGFPLLGDQKYAGNQNIPFSRTALHSHRLEFPHPMSKEILKFEDPLPKDLELI